MTSYLFEVAAKNAVIKTVKENHGESFTIDQIHMVWFAHLLGFKKGIFIDAGKVAGKNNRIYEVTYDRDKNALYVDEYDKVENTVITEMDFIAH